MQRFMAENKRTLVLGFTCAVFVLLAQSSARADCVVNIGGTTAGTFLRNNTVINPTQLGLGFQGTNFNTTLTNPGATSVVNLGGLNLTPGGLLGSLGGLGGLGLQTGDTLRLLTNVSVNGSTLQPLTLVGTVGTGVNGTPVINFAPVTTTVVDAAAGACATFTVSANSLNLLDPIALLNGLRGNVTLNACGNCGAATPTPEPATMALLGTGLVGFAANRRRRRKTQASDPGDVAV